MASSPMGPATEASPDLSKDFEFHLEFNIEEDVEGELEEFVRLARLGLAIEARKHFEKTLRDHLHLFPVLAEYGEFLMSEDSYSELSLILPTANHEYRLSNDEWSLVGLLRALVRMHAGSSRGYTFDAARIWLSREVTNFTAARYENTMLDIAELSESDSLKLQCLEICLAIAVTPHRVENDFQPQHYAPDWDSLDMLLARGFDEAESAEQMRRHPNISFFKQKEFELLVSYLLEEGRPCEAQRFAKLLIVVASPQGAKRLYDAFLRVQAPEEEDASHQDFVAARASVCNAYLRFKLQHVDFENVSPIVREELGALEQAVRIDLGHLFPDFPLVGSIHVDDYLENLNKLRGISRRLDLAQLKPYMVAQESETDVQVASPTYQRLSPQQQSGPRRDTPQEVGRLSVTDQHGHNRSHSVSYDSQTGMSRPSSLYEEGSGTSRRSHVPSFRSNKPVKQADLYLLGQRKYIIDEASAADRARATALRMLEEEQNSELDKQEQETPEKQWLGRQRLQHSKEVRRKTYEILMAKDSRAMPAKYDPNHTSSRLYLTRPTYMKVNVRYLDPHVLDRRGLPWEYDSDPSYIIIKEYIDEKAQGELFEESKQLKSSRRHGRNRSPEVVNIVPPPPRSDLRSRLDHLEFLEEQAQRQYH